MYLPTRSEIAFHLRRLSWRCAAFFLGRSQELLGKRVFRAQLKHTLKVCDRLIIVAFGKQRDTEVQLGTC